MHHLLLENISKQKSSTLFNNAHVESFATSCSVFVYQIWTIFSLLEIPQAFAQKTKENPENPPVPKRPCAYLHVSSQTRANYLCQGNEQNQEAKMKTNVFFTKKEKGERKVREKKKERETLNNAGQKIHKNVIHCHSKVKKQKKR